MERVKTEKWKGSENREEGSGMRRRGRTGRRKGGIVWLEERVMLGNFIIVKGMTGNDLKRKKERNDRKREKTMKKELCWRLVVRSRERQGNRRYYRS